MLQGIVPSLPWTFQLEQLINFTEMKGWAVDFLDFKATVSVLLYKRWKMEVKYLPCVWCILMLGAEPCLKTYEYHPWHWTLHWQRKYHFSNYKQFLKQVVSDWKKRHFYFISPVSEAMIWFKPWNIISLKTANVNLPYLFFCFLFYKKRPTPSLICQTESCKRKRPE